jgi:hypothetical protein
MKRIAALLAGLLLSALASAATGGLSLTAPTTRVDGSPLLASEIASYTIACTYTPTGGVAAACVALTPTSLPGASVGGTVTFTVSQNGQACFTLATVDTGGRVSLPTNAACKAVTIANPNPPTGVTVAVVLDLNMAPVFKLTATGGRQTEAAGFVVLGTPCIGNVLFSYRGNSYRRIDPVAVKWWGAIVPSTSVAAPCAAG